jgi:pyruvate, water dikinase
MISSRPSPSGHPEFAQFLVEQKIDSISSNPNTVVKIAVAILEKENSLNQTSKERTK